MTPNNTHYSLLVGLCVGLCVQHSSEAFGDSWTGSPEAGYNLASGIAKLGSGWSVDPTMFSAIFYPHISSSPKHSFLFSFLFFSHIIPPDHSLASLSSPLSWLLLSQRSIVPPFPFRKEQAFHWYQQNIIT